MGNPSPSRFSVGRSKPVLLQYVIGDNDLQRVDVINDLGVLLDNGMTFFNHIGSSMSKSASDDPYPYTFKALYVAFCPVRFGVCIVREEAHSRIERIQHKFTRFTL
jgi:hypothetical protein